MYQFFKFAFAIVILVVTLTTPTLALDLNSFCAQHKRPLLSVSATLAGLAYEQANAMAGRAQIDHKDFRKRIGLIGSTHAENVLVGCDDEACAIARWAKSAGHRTGVNTLMTRTSTL
jgi:hypothetical protein